MARYTAAVIGTGSDPSEMSKDGFAIGYRHGEAYEHLAECELIACADLVEENAQAFAHEFGLRDSAYATCEAMLETERPDIVSVSVPPDSHAELVRECSRAESVEAIHCEKPMATTMADCRSMVDECERRDVQLTINHQRRFGQPFRVAEERLEDGEIGELQRLECSGSNIYDYGTHLLDLCNFFVGDVEVEWVLGQIDYREENKWFGTHNENQALATWQYTNGVTALASTGQSTRNDLVGAHHRLLGSEGIIEIGRGYPSDIDPEHQVSISRSDEAGTETVETGDDGLHDSVCFTRAVEAAVTAIDGSEPCTLDARNALVAMEIIFGVYESARRRGRVDLPLSIDGNPLKEMIDVGEIDPSPAE